MRLLADLYCDVFQHARRRTANVDTLWTSDAVRISEQRQANKAKKATQTHLESCSELGNDVVHFRLAAAHIKALNFIALFFVLTRSWYVRLCACCVCGAENLVCFSVPVSSLVSVSSAQFKTKVLSVDERALGTHLQFVF